MVVMIPEGYCKFTYNYQRVLGLSRQDPETENDIPNVYSYKLAYQVLIAFPQQDHTSFQQVMTNHICKQPLLSSMLLAHPVIK